MNLTTRQKILLPVVAVPILLTLFFIISAFILGTPGFKVDKTQNGLLVSEIQGTQNQVRSGDLIVAVNGLSYGQVLGYLLTQPEQLEHNTFSLERDGQQLTFTLNTISYTLSSLLAVVWPHLLLITLFLSLGLTALLHAPPDKTTTLFFLMLCGFSSSVASTLASHAGLLNPMVMSTSFFGLAICNWLAFGAWVHFFCCFPNELDIVKNRPWLPFPFYLLPPAFAIFASFTIAGTTPEFWGWLQRLRNIFLPIIICGAFIKHIVDYRKLRADQARNQIKLPLAAYWLSFGPYLFLYLVPNLIFDYPLISFRTIILSFLFLPLAYLFALLRYRLFEVDKIISRIMAYVILIISITMLYSLFLIMIKQWLWGKGVLSEELFIVFLVLSITLFNPAVNWVQKNINRFIFGNIPIQTTILHNLSQRISTALQISDLIRVVTHDLPEQFGLNKVALAIIDNKQVRIHPEQSASPLVNLTDEHRVVTQLDGHDEYLLCRPVPGDIALSEEMEEFRHEGWTMIFRLQGSSSLTGILFISEKTNDRLFNDDDIQFLATLANHTGVALENGLRYERLARSKKQQEDIFKKLMQTEKMAAIGEMTTTLAHELKNPLAIIRSSAQYVAEGKQSPAVSQEMLGYIIDEIDTLNLTINSLLGLARHRAPNLKSVTLQDDLQPILERWKLSDKHNPAIKIIHDVPESLPAIRCDINQLSQIILNLVRNAEEAMPQTGKIQIQASITDNQVLISIKDTGPGIDPEDLRHVFDNFFTTKLSGVGLGLPVCRQLIHGHNGSISVKNRKNGGVEILILLPFEPFTELTTPIGKTTAPHTS